MKIYDTEHLIVTKEHEWYFTPPDEKCSRWLNALRLPIDNLEFLKELSRFFYYQMVQDGDYIKDEYKDLENLPERVDPSEVADKHGFYEKMMDEWMPGTTPFEKALNTLRLIQKANKGKTPPMKPNGKPSLTEMLPRLREIKPDREKFENSTWNDLLNQRGMDEFDKKVDALNKVAIVESFGKSFEIKKTVETHKAFNSEKQKVMRMTEYSEITKSLLYQRMFPNYRQKLITKDLPITCPIRTEESKQKIIILVDFSGSMHIEFKQQWVLSIIADRLYYASKEECEIFFSFFIADLGPGGFEHIYNKQTAEDFFRRFNIRPSGGDTQIGYVVSKIRKEVEKNSGSFFNLKGVDLYKDKPEILIINDGQDTVKTDKFDWKVNAVTLESRNDELKELCQKSGGKYVTINSRGEIGE